ncbi:flagellar hook-associated protein FlgK [Marinobacterium sp. AK62]|uniref:Flagellar hook-associated protein 1 n=1 Tax=Marinobacterium alkalitolerans TaxID=1542925 RepID=A0ABS3ZA66_9GAMM|nr:flagellar hook-associated protein FlgK [Marinobacterium alkalitolerans]MBP0048549.1 flagellar hook-associated protein FlgK [Marinobacterium alkalitolerans]
MSSSILNIGVQALNANQTALSNVGQNIANVNTDGYTRQTVQFGTQDPPVLGVEVQDIKRVTDQFLVRQVWSDTSVMSSNEAFSEKIALLDKMMVSESTSLSASMDSYFESLQQVVDDPLFIANRELFLAEAKSLTNSFTDFDAKLREQSDLINTELRSMTNSVNSITQNIADLNVQIGTLDASGQNSNVLKDKRDLLVKELSGYINVDVIEQNGGSSYNVMMGQGQPLIIGSSAARLELRNSESDPSQLDIFMTNGATTANVTDQLGQGAIGGLRRYKDEVLNPTISEVGRLAIVFSESMNEQHRKGMDLNGDMGENLFTPIEYGQVTANSGNKNPTLSSTVNFYDVTDLTASDYEVKFTGVNDFVVTRLSDGQRFDMSDFTDIATLPSDQQTLQQDRVFERDGNKLKISLDGMTVHLEASSSGYSTGDSFLVQPTRTGAQLMDTEITNPKLLALASPLRAEAASTNSGNAEIAALEVTNAKDTSALRSGNVTLPLEIVFNAPAAGSDVPTFTVYDMSDPDNPVVFDDMEQIEYAEGEPIELEDYGITLENQPNPGDRFTIERNVDGYSDNSNALAMSNFQDEPLVNGFSYQDTYGQMLAKVGTQASTSEIAYTSSKAVLQSSESALQSVAGVNLDEEAANLVKFQQAYSASAQLISAYQSIFDSLISAVRR